jgi:hypothetical protein
MCGFLGAVLFIFVFCQVGFESLCEFAPGKHDASPAALAFQPNIRAETSHRPLIGTTRMLFTESQVVVEAEVGEHEKIRGLEGRRFRWRWIE